MAGRLSLFTACALLAAVAPAAGGAELGEARVASWIGQPLAADIELLMLDDPAGQVEARLAHPNVYRGANIGMPPVLSTLAMSVTRRDGRQFLHVTSRTPVESSHLHLYLELVDGGQRNVRLVTLLLAPDPNPAPPPRPAPIPLPAPVPPPAPMPEPLRAPPAPAVQEASATPKPAQVPRQAAPARPKPAPRPAPAAALAPPVLPTRPAAPATCTPVPGGEPALCAALDDKNMQLRQQIGVLEDKVKALQATLGAAPAAKIAPKAADAPKPHPLRKKPAPEPDAAGGAPWGWIGAAVVAALALAGAALVLLRRRAGGFAFKRPALPRLPSLPSLAQLRQRVARKKAAQEGSASG